MAAKIITGTNAQYHADHSKVGSTMMKVILSSPAEYHDAFVADPPKIVTEPTKDMIIGSVVHCLVLEPENFNKLFACRPPGIDGRTVDGKKKLAEFRLSLIGKQELDADDLAKAKRMATAVLTNPLVQELVEGAIIERGIAWEENRIEFKCKPDWFIPRPELETDLHLDLKKSNDPTPENWLSTSTFAPMKKYRYDMQVSAHYPAGIEALTGRKCASGVVVVGDSEPHDVYIYDTTPRWEVGEWWRRRAIQLIQDCRESGKWQRQEQTEVTAMPAPGPYDFKEMQ